MLQWTSSGQKGGGGDSAVRGSGGVGYDAMYSPRHRACLGGRAPVPSCRTIFITSPSSVTGTASAGGCL